MKKTYNISLLVTCLAALLLVSCSKPEQNIMTAVTGLIADGDDESVELNWKPARNSYPTDYQISYRDDRGEEVILKTSGKSSFIVENLTNGQLYTFSVVACFNDVQSKSRTVQCKPVSNRIPVRNFGPEDVGNAKVSLVWERPASTIIRGYKLEYGIVGAEKTSIDISDPEVTRYLCENLQNDETYEFVLYGVYPKGLSAPAVSEAIPAAEKPGRTNIPETSWGMPITYYFDESVFEAGTTIANIRWTFPDGVEKEGKEVTYIIRTPGKQSVQLSADVNGTNKRWSVIVNIKEYLIDCCDWAICEGYTFNGMHCTTPVFSPDGKTVYVNSFRYLIGLYAFDTESGMPKWRWVSDDIGTSSYNGISVNPVTGDIYLPTGDQDMGNLYCIDSEGKLKWTYNGISGSRSVIPAVSKDGSMVFYSDYGGTVMALDAETGNEIWNAIYIRGAALLVNGDDLLLANCISKNSPTLYFLDTKTGNKKASWTSPDAAATENTGFAVSPDKKYAYLPLKYGKIAKINLVTRKVETVAQIDTPIWIVGADGVTKQQDDNRLWDICVASDGTMFVARKVTQKNLDNVGGTVSSNCYILDSNMKKIKSLALSPGRANVFNYSHPCCDALGNFYIAEANAPCNVYRISKDGSKVTKLQSYGTVELPQSSMNGCNLMKGVLYTVHRGSSNNSGCLKAFYMGEEFQRAGSWSSVGGDQCASCCVK